MPLLRQTTCLSMTCRDSLSKCLHAAYCPKTTNQGHDIPPRVTLWEVRESEHVSDLIHFQILINILEQV